MQNNSNSYIINNESPLHSSIKPKDIGEMLENIENGNLSGNDQKHYRSPKWDILDNVPIDEENRVLTDKPGPIPILRPMGRGKSDKTNAHEVYLENGNKDRIFAMDNRVPSTVEFWKNTTYNDIGYHDKDGQYHECKPHLHLGSEDKVFGIVYCITKVLHYDPSIDYVEEAKERYNDPSTPKYNEDRINAVRLAINRASGVYDEASRVAKLLNSRKLTKEAYNNTVRGMNIPVIIKLWGLIPESKFTADKVYYYHSATGVIIHKGFGRRMLPNEIINAGRMFNNKLLCSRGNYCISENLDLIDNEGSLSNNLWVVGVTGPFKIKPKKDIDKKDGLYVTTSSYNRESGMYDKIETKRISLEDAEGILKNSKREALIGGSKEYAERLLRETLEEHKEFSIYKEKEELKTNWFISKCKAEAMFMTAEHGVKLETLDIKLKTVIEKSKSDNKVGFMKNITQTLSTAKTLLGFM